MRVRGRQSTASTRRSSETTRLRMRSQSWPVALRPSVLHCAPFVAAQTRVTIPPQPPPGECVEDSPATGESPDQLRGDDGGPDATSLEPTSTHSGRHEPQAHRAVCPKRLGTLTPRSGRREDHQD